MTIYIYIFINFDQFYFFCFIIFQMWALCSKDVVKSGMKYPLKSSYFGKRVVRSDVSPEMKAKFQQVEVGDTAMKTNLVSRRSPSEKIPHPKKPGYATGGTKGTRNGKAVRVLRYGKILGQ